MADDTQGPLRVDCNGRKLTERQAALYHAVEKHGVGVLRRRERLYYWLGASAVREGLKHVRRPLSWARVLGAFWAGFDHERRRCGDGGMPEHGKLPAIPPLYELGRMIDDLEKEEKLGS